jgi:4-hydroxy-2-oxoheptanedioate aldolase
MGKNTMLRTNKTKEKLEAGEAVLGAMINIPEPALVEICGFAGYDFVFIDGEHGAIEVGAVLAMVRAADLHNLASVVRVAHNTPHIIARVLDAGATGIIVPNVRTAEDARRAVQATKHAPLGLRGVGSGRSRGYTQLLSVGRYAEMANAETMVVALLEHIDVLENLDAILDVKGLDVFIVGSNDLSQSMGLLGQAEHPRFQEVRRTIIDRVLQAARVMGTRIQTAEDARRSLDRGFRWLHVDLQGMLLTTASRLAEDVGSLM